MLTANSLKLNKPLKLAAFAGIIACFLFLHLYSLGLTPGFHFDEGWAMNFSHQIAFEPGFWPLGAMTPYTAAWTHYFAALFMRLFSPSVEVFRFSQVLLALLGMGFLFRVLWKRHSLSAGFYFLLAVILLPGLVLNHRFAVELNSFHVFCFGGLIWAMSTRRAEWAAFFFLAGATSHILFYSLGLGFVAAVLWERVSLSARERKIICLVFFLLSLFFLYVALSIAEKNKGIALLISSLSALIIFLFKLDQKKIWRFFCREKVMQVLALVFIVNAFFFSEGMWNLAIQRGMKMWENWQGLALFFFLPSIYFIHIGFKNLPSFYRRWFLLGIIFLGAIILKPAPRYYEWTLLAGAFCMAIGFYRRKKLALFFMPFLLLHGAVIYYSYFTETTREESLRLFVWKDSSRDFLSKQSLAAFLGGSGCKLSDINGVDFRVKESLRAISYASWPVANQPCAWKNGVNISLRSEYAEQPGDNETAIADFFVWERK